MVLLLLTYKSSLINPPFHFTRHNSGIISFLYGKVNNNCPIINMLMIERLSLVACTDGRFMECLNGDVLR